MSNPVKGETTFEALGKSWRFKMGNMALVELESLFQKNIAAVLDMFQNSEAKQMTLIQTVVVAGLRRFHSDITKETASDIVDDLGYDRIAEIILGSVKAAMPEGDATENPK